MLEVSSVSAPVCLPSLSANDGDMCVFGDGADVTDFSDSVDTQPQGGIATKDTAASTRAASSATLSDFGGIDEASDARLEAIRRDGCAVDAERAVDRCRTTHAYNEPWPGFCGDAGEAQQQRCIDQKAEPDCDRTRASCDEAVQAEIGYRADRAYKRCIEVNTNVDRELCRRQPTLLTRDGREVDCAPYRRYGENAMNVQDATTDGQGLQRATAATEEDSESRDITGEVGGKLGVPGVGELNGKGAWTESSGHRSATMVSDAITRNRSRMQGSVVMREATRGWQDDCDTLRRRITLEVQSSQYNPWATQADGE